MFAVCGAGRLLSASGFGVHHIVQRLREAVLDRMGRPAEMSCLVFPSEDAGVRLSQF